ncbi:MAG: hypothetical protein WKG07_49120 [Hymenobacter sp.]
MYRVTADFETQELERGDTYLIKYDIATGRLSLVEVASLIAEGGALDLLDHMDFDEEGYELSMHADSEESMQKFATVVCPTFRDIEELERYVRRIADWLGILFLTRRSPISLFVVPLRNEINPLSFD